MGLDLEEVLLVLKLLEDLAVPAEETLSADQFPEDHLNPKKHRTEHGKKLLRQEAV